MCDHSLVSPQSQVHLKRLTLLCRQSVNHVCVCVFMEISLISKLSFLPVRLHVQSVQYFTFVDQFLFFVCVCQRFAETSH